MFGRTDKEQEEIYKRRRAERRELDRREEDVTEREKDVDHKIELAAKNRNHSEAIAAIASQDQKLEEDHARRVTELAKELEQIEKDHEQRMEVLRAEEKLQQQKIASIEAKNSKELELVDGRIMGIKEAHEMVILAKDEVISTLSKQLETVTEKLIAKLPNIDVKDITVVPGAAAQKGGDQKKQDGQK